MRDFFVCFALLVRFLSHLIVFPLRGVLLSSLAKVAEKREEGRISHQVRIDRTLIVSLGLAILQLDGHQKTGLALNMRGNPGFLPARPSEGITFPMPELLTLLNTRRTLPYLAVIANPLETLLPAPTVGVTPTPLA